MSNLIVTCQKLFIRSVFPVTCETHGIREEVAQGLRRKVDEPDGGQDANHKYNGDEVDLSTDCSLNFQRNQTGVHADMNGARNAGQNRTANLHEIAHPGQAALHRHRVVPVPRSNFFGNSGDKSVGDKIAGFVI